MRSLLEKAIVHLLNGDETKAAALFHKFMVERARQIHESLRENDGSDEGLDDNWDQEIKEEEYFDDSELGGDEGMGDQPEMSGAEDDGMGDMGGDVPTEEVGDEMPDADAEGDFDPEGDDSFDDESEFGADDMESEDGDVGSKIDDLSDKIDALTAEFDRMMSEMGGDDEMSMDDSADDMTDDMSGDMPAGDEFGDETEMEGDEPPMGPEPVEGEGDLAGRMEDDMADDGEGIPPEHEMSEEEEMGDDLADITESVLAELDKISPPSNSEGKEVGAGKTAAPNKTSPVPHHNVMDRIKGEPVMTKGPTHSGYAKEPHPPIASPTKLVKDVRKGNRRNSFKDTTATVSDKGDAGALLHKDFAGGPKPTRSIVDGKKGSSI